MAKAVLNTVEVAPAVPAKVERKVVLTLTEAEAQALYTVLDYTGGADEVYKTWDALYVAGVGKGNPFILENRNTLTSSPGTPSLSRNVKRK